MKRTPSLGLIGLGVLVVGLPLAGWWLRQDSEPRCAFDGLTIQPAFQVRVVDQEEQSHRFCGVRCARLWLTRQESTPEEIRVTDEVSGEEIDARFAHFAQSAVLTDAISGNRIHVFGDEAAAEEHARSFQGWVLTDEERPFPDTTD